ncbi:hypothetical protein D3C76_1638550 [compost metagenome]
MANGSVTFCRRANKPSLPLKILVRSAALVEATLSHFLSSRLSAPPSWAEVTPKAASDFKVPLPDTALISSRMEDNKVRIVASPVSAAAVMVPLAFLVTLVSAFMTVSRAL